MTGPDHIPDSRGLDPAAGCIGFPENNVYLLNNLIVILQIMFCSKRKSHRFFFVLNVLKS